MSTSQAPSGVLVVDKPAGPTSHDVVAVARRALRCRKIGHLGTLDPLATGVLPLVVGRATRLAPLFSGAGKQYDAVVRLGLSTDTDDIGGVVIGGRDAADGDAPAAPPSARAIEEAAAGFVGSHLQRPPAVSAKKIEGVRAYDLARRRRPAAPEPVRVAVESLAVLSVDGPRVRCRIACSSGFYVRALARDLGEKLGCGGCLETLRRERHGRFTLDDAVPLARLVEEGPAAADCLIPPGELLPELRGVVVTERGARRAAHGNPLGPSDIVSDVSGRDGTAPTCGRVGGAARGGAGAAARADAGAALPAAGGGRPGPGERIRVLDAAGGLLAIAEPVAGGLLHPKIVLV